VFRTVAMSTPVRLVSSRDPWATTVFFDLEEH
jgi:hypothetical protein